MNLLLDTHVLIWFITRDPRLPRSVLEWIMREDHRCYISIASIWEMCIKQRLGKLQLGMTFEDLGHILYDSGIELLPIAMEHMHCLSGLALHHKDPFDRLIISQALVEQLDIVSRDAYFPKYTKRVVWGENRAS